MTSSVLADGTWVGVEVTESCSVGEGKDVAVRWGVRVAAVAGGSVLVGTAEGVAVVRIGVLAAVMVEAADE
jgi:hypothetical protein